MGLNMFTLELSSDEFETVYAALLRARSAWQVTLENHRGLRKRFADKVLKDLIRFNVAASVKMDEARVVSARLRRAVSGAKRRCSCRETTGMHTRTGLDCKGAQCSAGRAPAPGRRRSGP